MIQLAEAHQASKESRPWRKLVRNFSVTSSKITLLSVRGAQPRTETTVPQNGKDPQKTMRNYGT